MFKISFSNIFIMDADFAGLCENVNNFSYDGIFASDRGLFRSVSFYHRPKMRQYLSFRFSIKYICFRLVSASSANSDKDKADVVRINSILISDRETPLILPASHIISRNLSTGKARTEFCKGFQRISEI
jgi:hypothetical protein